MLHREQEHKSATFKKIRNRIVLIVVLVVGILEFIQLTKKSPEQIKFEQQVQAASLDGKVKEFPIEGRNHVSASTAVDYKTNPPTSGDHLAEAENWGVYNKEIDDKAAVHGLEHGGIWISYKDIDDDSKKILADIGHANSQSVIVSPRSADDTKIAVVSWGRMMKLETADKVLIQKYIYTYKNQGPEKLAN